MELVSAGISLAGAIVSMGVADEADKKASAAHAEAFGFATDEREKLGLLAKNERARTDDYRQKTKEYIMGSGADPLIASQIQKQASQNLRSIEAQGAMGGAYAGDQARQVQYNQGNAMTQNAFQTNAQRLRMAQQEGDISNVLNLDSRAADASKVIGLKKGESDRYFGIAGAASDAAAKGFQAAAKGIGSAPNPFASADVNSSINPGTIGPMPGEGATDFGGGPR